MISLQIQIAVPNDRPDLDGERELLVGVGQLHGVHAVLEDHGVGVDAHERLLPDERVATFESMSDLDIDADGDQELLVGHLRRQDLVDDRPELDGVHREFRPVGTNGLKVEPRPDLRDVVLTSGTLS